MKTLTSFIKHIGYAVIVLLAVIVLNFLLIQLAPGDAVTVMIGDMGGASPELIAKLRAEYGLNQDILTQLGKYVLKMATGDLGISYTYQQPVIKLITDRMPATILLVATAILFAVFVGTLLGAISAQKPDSPLNYAVTVLSLIGFAMPVFWTGIMLLILFSYYIPIFPSSGMETVPFTGTMLESAVDIAKHLILPAFTLASIYLAYYSRIARASMLDVLGSDYIRTARSKGLSNRVVVYKHALKNAVLPVVTIAGFQFGQIIGGAVVVEIVFSWPGLGQLVLSSILRRDFPLLLGILFFSTLIVVIFNILTDLTYRLLDPRIK